jgi:hypothetical protein
MKQFRADATFQPRPTRALNMLYPKHSYFHSHAPAQHMCKECSLSPTMQSLHIRLLPFLLLLLLSHRLSRAYLEDPDSIGIRHWKA